MSGPPIHYGRDNLLTFRAPGGSNLTASGYAQVDSANVVYDVNKGGFVADTTTSGGVRFFQGRMMVTFTAFSGGSSDVVQVAIIGADAADGTGEPIILAMVRKGVPADNALGVADDRNLGTFAFDFNNFAGTGRRHKRFILLRHALTSGATVNYSAYLSDRPNG